MEKKSENYLQQKTFFNSNKTYQLNAGMNFTSFVVQIDESSSFENAYSILEKDTIPLSRDDHSPVQNGRINSNLISLPNQNSLIHLYSGNIKGEIRLHLINGSKSDGIEEAFQTDVSNDCTTEPTNIAQTNWRSGLSAPVYTRAFTDVNHVIVHHSAGSNTNTNFTQVVRDIYLYHTEVNGWSDIGYNYLIAQDGTIYAGRDPDGGAQDDVRGAHFCGMNSGTMGICLLGNYVNTAPTNEAISSLITLASWKLNKQDLNPYDAFPFRSLSSLGSLSGHRDGCATECPGQMTYDQVDQIKSAINSSLLECDEVQEFSSAFSFSDTQIFIGETINFIDNSFGEITSWHWTFEGGEPETSLEQHPQNITYNNTGNFAVRLVVRGGSRIDTLSMPDAIEVLEATPGITVFPNPIRKGDLLTIRINTEKSGNPIITNMSGQQIVLIPETYKDGTLDTSALQKGLYVLHYQDGTSQETKRFVIF